MTRRTPGRRHPVLLVHVVDVGVDGRATANAFEPLPGDDDFNPLPMHGSVGVRHLLGTVFDQMRGIALALGKWASALHCDFVAAFVLNEAGLL